MFAPTCTVENASNIPYRPHLMATVTQNVGVKQNLQCACSITYNFMKPINRVRELFGRCLAQLAPKALCGQNANLADL